MKKVQFLFLLLIASLAFGQYSISGNFSPAKDFKWLIAYEQSPTGQNYIGDTAVKDGYFKLELPVTAQPGIYRLVYAVPQDEFYIDVIYNKKEDIEFNFNLEEGATFIKSKENLLYSSYFNKIGEIENKILNYYESGKTSEKEFMELSKTLDATQNEFERMAPESMAHQFITANKPYIPDNYESVETYLQHKKATYFEHLDVHNPTLQASGFITDKINNYVFSALSPSIGTQLEMENEIKENIAVAYKELKATSKAYQLAVFNKMWNTAQDNNQNAVADFVYESYLKDLALENGNSALIDEIEATSRLRLGATSPEITWQKDGTEHKLSDLKGAENYVLIFWSSTCSHCLKEVPLLHKELKNYPKVKVLAIGLEDDDANWKKEVANLPGFEHALALGKWESDYAKLFAIDKTPTYLILDAEKRFISKPDSDKELIEFLRK